MKKYIIAISIIVALVGLYFAINTCCINHYLKKYGYGSQYLGKAVAVWMGFNDGFTVKKDDYSFFIGKSDSSFYKEKYNNKKYSSEEEGLNIFVTDKNDKNRYCIGAEDDWCHWFRVYTFESQNKKITKIENLK